MVKMRTPEVKHLKAILLLGVKFFAKMKQKNVGNRSISKYSHTVTRKLLGRKAGFVTSVANSLFLGQNSWTSEVTG
jgi:hypothetical protein